MSDHEPMNCSRTYKNKDGLFFTYATVHAGGHYSCLVRAVQDRGLWRFGFPIKAGR